MEQFTLAGNRLLAAAGEGSSSYAECSRHTARAGNRRRLRGFVSSSWPPPSHTTCFAPYLHHAGHRSGNTSLPAATSKRCDELQFWRDLTARGTHITRPALLNDSTNPTPATCCEQPEELDSDRLHAHVGHSTTGCSQRIGDDGQRPGRRATTTRPAATSIRLHYQGTVAFPQYAGKEGIIRRRRPRNRATQVDGYCSR